jgi:2-dehydropantoate 2-reductase
MMKDHGSPILVWGAGAIGGTVGAFLVRAGLDVLFVDNAEDHVLAMQREGLSIEGPLEEFNVAVQAITPDRVTGHFDRIFLCVKAQHTKEAAASLEPHLSTSGYVVSLQNGLNEREIAEAVGASRTIGAFVNFGADYLAPGRILFGGRGALVLGEIDGQKSDRLRALRDLVSAFEPGAIITDNIWGYLWGKMGYGALLFATALTNASIADALDQLGHRPVFIALAREVVATTDALGIRSERFNGFDPSAFRPGASDAATTASFDEMVAFNRRSAKTHSGIWRDLAVRKRRTEVDAQLGPLVREAAQLGLATPVSEALIALIHDIEEGRRPLSEANLVALGEAMP